MGLSRIIIGLYLHIKIYSDCRMENRFKTGVD